MTQKRARSIACLVIAALFTACGGGSSNDPMTPGAPAASGGPSSADVVTFKNDVARTGQYLVETTLTPANVNSTSFGLLHNLKVDGKVDAQPLYLSQIGSTPHNVVYVATEHGSVYAFDADSGAPLWQVSLLASGETPSDTHGCDQVVPEIGITSTPVIDRTAGAHGSIYVVAMSIDTASKYHQRLHALDLTTGAELLNGPTEISATFPNSTGTTTFEPGQYEERAALLLVNGTIYTSWTSHCDIAPYSGWIIAFNQATLARAAVLNIGPNSGVQINGSNGFATNGPSIWMAGDGPGADPAGNIYLLSGNGRFETTLDANGFPSQGDYGNSFVKIASSGGTLSVADYFTLFNERQHQHGQASRRWSRQGRQNLSRRSRQHGEVQLHEEHYLAGARQRAGRPDLLLAGLLQRQSLLRRGRQHAQGLRHECRQGLGGAHFAVARDLRLSRDLTRRLRERHDERHRVDSREPEQRGDCSSPRLRCGQPRP
jgi:hypothetical protein